MTEKLSRAPMFPLGVDYLLLIIKISIPVSLFVPIEEVLPILFGIVVTGFLKDKLNLYHNVTLQN